MFNVLGKERTPLEQVEYCRNLRDRLMACYNEGGTNKDPEVLHVMTLIMTSKIDMLIAHKEELHMALDMFTSRTDYIGKTAKEILEFWIRTVHAGRKFAEFDVPLLQSNDCCNSTDPVYLPV